MFLRTLNQFKSLILYALIIVIIDVSEDTHLWPWCETFSWPKPGEKYWCLMPQQVHQERRLQDAESSSSTRFDEIRGFHAEDWPQNAYYRMPICQGPRQSSILLGKQNMDINMPVFRTIPTLQLYNGFSVFTKIAKLLLAFQQNWGK